MKWQRNAIFEAVVKGGLDARECTFDYDDATARITHMPSGSYFLLEGDAGRYTATAIVGDGPSWPSDSFIWTNVQDRVQRWAEEVKGDVETPDLWAELQREREILTGARYQDVENTPFTSDEQAEISEQLRQIKELMQGSLSEVQMRSLEQRLGEIEAAAGRIGRKDWLLLFLGAMFTELVTGVLPPEAVQRIVTMGLHGLDQLFGGGAMPPQLLP